MRAGATAMAFMAAANVLSAMGHLANLGQIADVGVAHLHQKEQMEWARRAYRLDSRTLRIDLLNAVKEDVRDHYDTYAGRIDTLLLVHTLLLTFALATLQFSDQYVPQTEDACPHCVEVVYTWLVPLWVYLIAAILILPFWCILMLLWCKLRLDKWLEISVRRLNSELRATLSSSGFYKVCDSMSAVSATARQELECVEQAIERLGRFVVDHQDRFAEVWSGECDGMIRATTNLLWVNAVVAVSITAGMFWMFLRNNLNEYQHVAAQFMILVIAGLLAPVVYLAWRRRRALQGFCVKERDLDDYVSCSDSGQEEPANASTLPRDWSSKGAAASPRLDVRSLSRRSTTTPTAWLARLASGKLGSDESSPESRGSPPRS